MWAVVDGQDVRVRTEDVTRGMVLHLGAGSVLPVDGTVVEGAGEIDESSMTGEAALVRKEPGATVYAGTALESGDLKVSVTAPPGASRIDGIVDMVEHSSELKAGAQSRAERLADAIVPYSFLAFFGILAVTRNINKAMAVLMVDYSCAIKLSTPIAVMSAMDEAVCAGVTVRGGKYLEALAAADTVVFDKTGTLTNATPAVSRIVSFTEASEEDVLRLAACIEEHFPHSMARAIVAEAERRGLVHDDELHAEVQYVVAHGISTRVGGREVCIGSAHFLFEDEGVGKPEGLDELMEREAPASSVIHIARERQLVGAICVSDPPRAEAAAVLARLRRHGLSNLVMITGDSERCAAHVAGERLGLDGFAQVLPEDKAAHVAALRGPATPWSWWATASMTRRRWPPPTSALPCPTRATSPARWPTSWCTTPRCSPWSPCASWRAASWGASMRTTASSWGSTRCSSVWAWQAPSPSPRPPTCTTSPPCASKRHPSGAPPGARPRMLS